MIVTIRNSTTTFCDPIISLQPMNAALLWRVFKKVAKNIEATHPDKHYLRAFVQHGFYWFVNGLFLQAAAPASTGPSLTSSSNSSSVSSSVSSVAYSASSAISISDIDNYVLIESCDDHAYLRTNSDEGYSSSFNSSQIVGTICNPTQKLSHSQANAQVKQLQQLREPDGKVGFQHSGFSVHNFNPAYLHQVPSCCLAWTPSQMIVRSADFELDISDSAKSTSDSSTSSTRSASTASSAASSALSSSALKSYGVGPKAKPSVIIHAKFTHPSSAGFWFEMRMFKQHRDFGLYFQPPSQQFALHALSAEVVSQAVPAILDIRAFMQAFCFRMNNTWQSLLGASFESQTTNSSSSCFTMSSSHTDWFITAITSLLQIISFSVPKLPAGICQIKTPFSCFSRSKILKYVPVSNVTDELLLGPVRMQALHVQEMADTAVKSISAYVLLILHFLT